MAFLTEKPCGHTFWCCCNKREDAVQPLGDSPRDEESLGVHRAHLFTSPVRVGAEGTVRGLDATDVGGRHAPVAGSRVLVRGTYKWGAGTVIGPLTKDPEGSYIVIQFDREPIQPFAIHKDLIVLLSENS